MTSMLIAFIAVAQAAAAPEPMQATAPVKPKLICKDEEVPGSRLRQRNCATAEVWLARERQRRDGGQLMRSRAGDATDRSM